VVLTAVNGSSTLLVRGECLAVIAGDGRKCVGLSEAVRNRVGVRAGVPKGGSCEGGLTGTRWGVWTADLLWGRGVRRALEERAVCWSFVLCKGEKVDSLLDSQTSHRIRKLA
jgi:hypothetical protein